MFEFDTDVDKKLNAPSKRKIYDMLVGRARECLKTAKSVCLLGLSNWRYGEWILDEQKNVERVTIVESSQLKFMYRDLEKLNRYNIIYVNDDEYVEALERLSMKFDCIIMNPPYQRNLHLKILAEAIKHLKDDGTCVNLSPVRWLQDPLAKYKKNCDLKRFEKSVAKHIGTLDVVSMAEANAMFGDNGGTRAVATMELGLYSLKIAVLDNFKKFTCSSSIIDKVMSKLELSFADVIENRKLDGWRVRVNEMQPLETLEEKVETNKWRYHIINPNTETYVYKDGYTEHTNKFWTELITKNGFVKDGDALPHSIKFGTKEEAYNFEAYCKTTFMDALKVLGQRDVNVPLFIFPFLGNIINPRTGLKGYKGEWTNDDLYKFFNITPEEQKVIEETMEKYR